MIDTFSRTLCEFLSFSMESQPQNPEFRIHPKNFHQCIVEEFNHVGNVFNQAIFYKHDKVMLNSHQELAMTRMVGKTNWLAFR